MATSQISVVRDTLKTVFTDAGHDFYAYNPGDQADSLEYGYFDRITSDQEWFDLSGNRNETLTINGRVRVEKSGAAQSVAKAAEDAALAILDDLETSLVSDPTLSATGWAVELVGPTDSVVMPFDNSYICVLDIVITAEVIL